MGCSTPHVGSCILRVQLCRYLCILQGRLCIAQLQVRCSPTANKSKAHLCYDQANLTHTYELTDALCSHCPEHQQQFVMYGCDMSCHLVVGSQEGVRMMSQFPGRSCCCAV